MNAKRRSWIRIVSYWVVIGVLLIPLHAMSRPTTSKSTGGVLARLREENRLSQAELGKIDPTSESLRLATLGLTGIAANILWTQANHYKKVEDWTSFDTVLRQIIHLQPNFISVWRFQAWNLSYNVSAEFDDYRDRYYWVKQGIKYLEEGTKFNAAEPKLLWDVGWFYSQKIGRSDEKKQFRRLFRNDEDFHGPEAKTRDFDNWLVGKNWFEIAQGFADQGRPLRGMSPLIFHADPGMAQINYSDNLNEDGVFGERSAEAWQTSFDEFRGQYGNRLIPTTWGFDIRLNDLEPFQERVKDLKGQFEDLAPGLKQRVTEERRRTLLNPEELAAYDKPKEQRSAQEMSLAYDAAAKVEPAYAELAELFPADKILEGRKLAEEIKRLDDRINAIERYRQTVNFDYWVTRCEMERSETALRAHTLEHEARRKIELLDLQGAQADFEEAIKLWREILDRYPLIIEDRGHGEALQAMIEDYRKVLDQNEQSLPDPFVLQDVIDRYGGRTAPEAPTEEPAPDDSHSDDTAAENTAAEDAASPAGDTASPEPAPVEPVPETSP